MILLDDPLIAFVAVSLFFVAYMLIVDNLAQRKATANLKRDFPHIHRRGHDNV